jgi:hypothetical protein
MGNETTPRWMQANDPGTWVRAYALWAGSPTTRAHAHLRAHVTDQGLGMVEGHVELHLPGVQTRPYWRDAPTVEACQQLLDDAAAEIAEAMFGLSCDYLTAGRDMDFDGDHGCEDLKQARPRLATIRCAVPATFNDDTNRSA